MQLLEPGVNNRDSAVYPAPMLTSVHCATETYSLLCLLTWTDKIYSVREGKPHRLGFSMYSDVVLMKMELGLG